ncbi:MAG: AI-2E family transporter [Elusimicrobiota bacterium]|nr:AI-2E family transporter [Elusimicrobiota bacterium]
MNRATAAAVAGAAAALLLGWALFDTLFPVFFGFALAYAFDPLADWLQRRKLSRDAAVILILSGVALLAVAAVGLVIPTLVSEARQFALDFPDYAAAAYDRLSGRLEPFGVRLPADKAALLEQLKSWLTGLSVAALAPVGLFAGRFFSGVAGTLTGLLNLVIVPVVFYYFLRDIDLFRPRLLSFVPPRHRAAANRWLSETDRVFSGYIRGQITVALILAVIYAAGLSLLGIRFGILIGLLSGLLNIVPYLGVFLGLSTSLVMTAVDFSGWGSVVGVLALFGVAQTLEGFVITPRIVGDKVGLSPVETIVALIIGGGWGGMPGMILAIPAAGCLKAYGRGAADAWRASSFYRG